MSSSRRARSRCSGGRPAISPRISSVSSCSVVVSSGRAPVKVPDVVGRSQAEASTVLQQAGLQVQVSQFFGDKVFRQSPAAGETVEIGTPVTILVTFGQD